MWGVIEQVLIKPKPVIMSHHCRKSDSQCVQPFLCGEGIMRERLNWLVAEEESIAKKHLHDLSDLESPDVLSA